MPEHFPMAPTRSNQLSRYVTLPTARGLLEVEADDAYCQVVASDIAFGNGGEATSWIAGRR